MEFIVTVQLGGKSHEKGCRKLAFACVSAFSWDLTSGGRPKLLVPDAFRGQEDDLAELLQFINGAERIASIRLHELTAGQAEIFFEQFKNSPFSEPCKTSWI